jgi:hypothetical protein
VTDDLAATAQCFYCEQSLERDQVEWEEGLGEPVPMCPGCAHPHPGPAWLWPLEWLSWAAADPAHAVRNRRLWLRALLRGQPSAAEYAACEADDVPWGNDDDRYHPVQLRSRVRVWRHQLWRLSVLRAWANYPRWPLDHPGKFVRALLLPSRFSKPGPDDQRLVLFVPRWDVEDGQE